MAMQSMSAVFTKMARRFFIPQLGTLEKLQAEPDGAKPPAEFEKVREECQE